MARDDSEVGPHDSVTVPADRKVVLYAPDGSELVRPIGFAPVPGVSATPRDLPGAGRSRAGRSDA